jgi:ribonuclease HI
MHAQPIVVFTDGAAKGNPGPGGWGAIIVTPLGEVTELGGRAAETTTNNRMEQCNQAASLAGSVFPPGNPYGTV